MTSWFDRHKRFGDCKPNEVYIGCGVFAAFDDESVRLRNDTGQSIRIDSGSIGILSGALAEFRSSKAQ